MEPLPKFQSATPARLTPAMASFKVLVLRFVIEYITANRISPSQGEIERGLNSTRTRVRDAIRALVKEGYLLSSGGERGLALPSEEGDAVRLLLKLGWRMADGVLEAPPRRPSDPVFTVPALVEIDYP